MSEDNKRVPSNFYTMNYDLGNGRQIQINGTLYEDESKAVKCAKLDDAVDILERERTRLEIESLEHREKQSVKQLSAELDVITLKQQQLARAAGKDKAPALKQEIAAREVTIGQIRESIEEGRREIEKKRQFVESRFGVTNAP